MLPILSTGSSEGVWQMERKKKILLCRVVSGIASVAILIAFLVMAGCILRPKYRSGSLEGSLTGEYYRDVSEVTHDLLFIGDCEVYESFIPAVLWQKYGISSYVRGSAQQLVWQSYYMLEDTLRYETPHVVVFNVLSLKYGDPQSEAYNRMTLDGMEWSSVKASAIRASMTEEESFLSYLFPVLRYHERWDELTAEDFLYAFGDGEPVSDSGYLMQTGVQARDFSVNDEELKKPLEETSLPASSMEWLDKLRLLCEENGIHLVLFKAPTNSWRYWWYDEWDSEISAYAARWSLSYCNAIPAADEIGLDWSTDTYDGGIHLNVSGAEKLSVWFGQYLRADSSLSETLPDRRSESVFSSVWEARVEKFEKRRQIC